MPRTLLYRGSLNRGSTVPGVSIHLTFITVQYVWIYSKTKKSKHVLHWVGKHDDYKENRRSIHTWSRPSLIFTPPQSPRLNAANISSASWNCLPLEIKKNISLMSIDSQVILKITITQGSEGGAANFPFVNFRCHSFKTLLTCYWEYFY